jgi:hypothetical protein
MVLTDPGVLYVVENLDVSRIAKVQLSKRYDEGRIVSRTASPRFRTPTTAAIATTDSWSSTASSTSQANPAHRGQHPLS